MKIHVYILIMLTSCLQVGCISHNTCTVDVSSSMDDRSGVVYSLETKADAVYSDQVDLVLQRNGFVPVALTAQSTPEIHIMLEATIRGPFRKTYTYYQPVFAPRSYCCSCPPERCRCSGHRTQTSYEIVASIKRTGSYEVYTRVLNLNATELKSGKGAWETTATSTGRADKLDQVFPVLLIAAEPFIATNTSTIRVLKKLNNPAVLALTAETKEN